MKEVINTYLPLKKLSKKELKIQAKPWITNGIRSSIKRQDTLRTKNFGHLNFGRKIFGQKLGKILPSYYTLTDFIL